MRHRASHVIAQELKDFGRLAGGVVAYCDIDKKNRGRGSAFPFSLKIPMLNFVVRQVH